jgi:tellurite resistance protein
VQVSAGLSGVAPSAFFSCTSAGIPLNSLLSNALVRACAVWMAMSSGLASSRVAGGLLATIRESEAVEAFGDTAAEPW